MGSMYNGTIKAAIAALSLIFNSTLCMWMQKKTDTNKSFMWIMYAQTAFLLILLTFRELSITIICDVLFFSINAVRLPLLQTMTSMRTTPENSNQVMGFYQSMTSLGGIFGALFAGLIYKVNPMYPFILAAAAFVVASLIGITYVGRYKKEKAVK